MSLELDSLRGAVEALGRSLDAAARAMPSAEDDLRETLRAGVIQHFEMAYEQCWKFMQRWVSLNVSPEDGEYPRTRKELFRTAARHGLIEGPEPWFGFGEARNMSSHTYDQGHAGSVYEAARRFLPQARDFVARLEARND